MEENKSNGINLTWILFTIGTLMVLNYLLSNLLEPGLARHLNGTVASPEEVRKAMVGALFISYPIFSFILGFILSLIPYKRLAYWKKYLPFSLLAMLVLNAITLLAQLIRLINAF